MAHGKDRSMMGEYTISTTGFWDRLDRKTEECERLQKEVDRLKLANKRLRAENRALEEKLATYV
jgi:hypothetical protein